MAYIQGEARGQHTLFPSTLDEMIPSDHVCRVIEALRVHVAGSTSLIICATFEDMSLVQRELIGALQRILVGLGAPPQLIFTTRAGWEARNRDAGNAHSRPDARRDIPSLI